MKNVIILAVIFLTLISVSSCVKTGCTNPEAANYDSKAKQDDGNCVIDYTAKLVGTYQGVVVDADESIEFPYHDERIVVTRVDNSHVSVAPASGGVADPFTALVQKVSNGNYVLIITYQTNANGNTIQGYEITTVDGIAINGAFEPATGTLRYGINITNLELIEAFEGTKQ